MQQRNTSGLRRGGGRPKGVPNKVTTEARAACAELVDDPRLSGPTEGATARRKTTAGARVPALALREGQTQRRPSGDGERTRPAQDYRDGAMGQKARGGAMSDQRDVAAGWTPYQPGQRSGA